MKKLWTYFSSYKKECVLGPLFKLLEASFELFIPLLVKQIIDIGIPAGDEAYILQRMLLMGALAFIGMVCSLTAQFFSARAAVGFSAKVKAAVFSHVQKLSYRELDSLGTSALITRLSSDINTLQGGVNMSLRLLLRSPFIVAGAVLMAFTIDFRSALLFVLTVFLLSVVVFGIMRITVPMHRQVQNRLDKVTADTRANLNGVRVIRAFGLEKTEEEHFRGENDRLVHIQILAGRISALLNPVTFVLINLGLILLIREGALAVDSGRLSRGAVVALINYMSQILVELIKLANLIVQLSRALACGGRISAVLETESSMREGEADPARKGGGESLELKDISFRYADGAEDALRHISLRLEPGETLGIIGGTGSGKSSLVNLIPRFHDVTEGAVLVNGTDVKDYTFSSLRGRIAIVPQKSVLFSGTLRENLCWGKKDATEEELCDALRRAQAYDFVMEKEDGLDCSVSKGGTNFSGGQRQRLAIARALVRHPAILILDDSASALDYATDAALRSSIHSLPDRPTTVIVSQRTASVMRADRILVLENGEAAGLGSHEELMKDCPVYREIYLSQFGGEEDAEQ
ncbi:MAG: ABC transporter ATP-binding protein [Lachnospiraceae bacterium]|nr:ABC transporter ATP-binding protein [Lachnospiraceae bacterium]